MKNPTHSSKLQQDGPDDKNRRKVLAWLVALINVAVIGAVFTPVIGFVTAPLRKSQKPGDWVPVLDDSALAEGETKGVEFRLKVQDGFYATERTYSVYLHRSGDQLVAFDPSCTHLGCRIEWQSDKKKYFCPCHGGVFSENGEVVSGPPPIPLRRHPVKTEGGKIFVNTDFITRSA